jgi:hypothetical protein
MKAIKYALLLFTVVSLDAWGLDVNRYLSGSWYNPAQDGHGFSVEVLPDDRTILYWYVYHPDGTPTFIIAIGENIGNTVRADAYYNTGMKFGEFDPADRTQIPWGTITMTFHSCDSATLQYSSDLDYNGVPWGSGSIPLSRLASIDGLQCAPNPYAGLYQGNFFSDVLNQVIPGYVVVAPNGEFAAVSFDAMAAIGNWTVNGKTFSGTGTAVSADPDFTFSSSLSMSGQISPDYRMVGNYTISGGDRGTFDFFAIPELYRRGISLAEIAGNYTARNLVSGATGTATISQSGSITASDSLGCTYQGQISVPDVRFNLISVTVVVSNCSISNGTYEGYGSQIDYDRLDDGRAIRLMATNGQYAGVFDLYR